MRNGCPLSADSQTCNTFKPSHNKPYFAHLHAHSGQHSAVVASPDPPRAFPRSDAAPTIPMQASIRFLSIDFKRAASRFESAASLFVSLADVPLPCHFLIPHWATGLNRHPLPPATTNDRWLAGWLPLPPTAAPGGDTAARQPYNGDGCCHGAASSSGPTRSTSSNALPKRCRPDHARMLRACNPIALTRFSRRISTPNRVCHREQIAPAATAAAPGVGTPAIRTDAAKARPLR